MGDTKKPKKKFSRPRKPWDANRLETERKIKTDYGLKNKREIRISEALVRTKRQNARKLLALTPEKRVIAEKLLVKSLSRVGLLGLDAGLDDVLGLGTKEVLERRLQTLVVRKGLANTSKQARQFITHGHIGVNGKRVSTPGYLVPKQDENQIAYYGKPMVLVAPTPKADLKKKFDEAKPAAEDEADLGIKAGEPGQAEEEKTGAN